MRNKIYLSSRYSRQKELRKYAKYLEEEGNIITSSWLYSEGDESVETEENIKKSAYKNLSDILYADFVLCFSEEPDNPYGRGGRHIETGYSLGKGIPVIVIGPVENSFHRLNEIKHFETWEDFVEFFLEELKEEDYER